MCVQTLITIPLRLAKTFEHTEFQVRSERCNFNFSKSVIMMTAF